MFLDCAKPVGWELFCTCTNSLYIFISTSAQSTYINDVFFQYIILGDCSNFILLFISIPFLYVFPMNDNKELDCMTLLLQICLPHKYS